MLNVKSTELSYSENHENEGENDEDDFLNDDVLKRIFRPKETNFKHIDPKSNDYNFLDPDLIIKGDMESFVDRDGRTILHRAALEQRIEVIT